MSDERHRDRPPVWDAVETDLFAPDRRRPVSAEGSLRGDATRISSALAVVTLTLVATRPAADAVVSLVIAGLIGLFCYLSQHRRSAEARMVIGAPSRQSSGALEPNPRNVSAAPQRPATYSGHSRGSAPG